MSSYIEKEADVLVIGAGLAGLWAAIRARDFADKVVLVEKGKIGRSGVSILCHTTVAPLPPGEYQSWFKEQVERGAYLADQRMVEIFLNENSERIREMISWGVEFERNADGSLKTEAVRGQKIVRSALYTGKQMMEKMKEEARRRGVEFEERVMMIEPLTSDGNLPTKGRVVGALGLKARTTDFVAYRAKAVVLATGLMSTRINVHYSNGLSGDGHAMAFRAGAELINMELASSLSFGIWNRRFATGGQQQFLMNGARIVNRLGERIMGRYATAAKVSNPEFEGHIEFGDICRAIAIENLEGRGPCYFDLSGWSRDNVDKMAKILPVTMAAFRNLGIDVTREKIESTPMTVTYCGGQGSGMRADSHFETTIPGLYVAGVTAYAGGGVLPQGFANVSGHRAGENAARRALETDYAPAPEEQVESFERKAAEWMREKGGASPDSLYLSLNKLLAPYGVGFFKNEARITSTLKALDRLEKEDLPRAFARDAHDLWKLYEFRNVLTVLKVIFSSARERKESRFGHYREEFPYRDDVNWLKWTVAKNDGMGEVSLRLEPIPFENFPVKPEKPSRIPSKTTYIMKA